MLSCTSCGSPIPEGQGRSCSMCYGDPYWGKDGYYLEFLEQAEREHQEKIAYERQIERQMEDDHKE